MSRCHSCARLALTIICALGAASGPHNSVGAEPTNVAVSSVAISSGELYLYGHRIAPPYDLVVRDDVFAVNGVRVFPPLRPPSVRDVDIAENTRLRHELRERLFALQAELEGAGKTSEEITPQLTEHLRAQSALVDSVTGASDDEFWIWWRGELQPEQFLVRRAPRSTRRCNARAEEEQYLLRHALERDCLVIVAPSRQLVFPPDPPERIAEVLEEIERARHADVGELTPEQWSGQHLDHDLARLFRHPLALPAEE